MAICVNNLGSVLQDLGDLPAARAAFERALAINERTFGPDHPNVAICVNNLGFVLQAQGDLPAARAAFERALAIDERTFGPDHPHVAIDVSNLGSVLQAWATCPRPEPPSSEPWPSPSAPSAPTTPTWPATRQNWAASCRPWATCPRRGRFERALAIDERTFGPDHLTVARTVNNLGLVLKAQGDLVAARAAYERALASAERTFGPDHPNVAKTISNLGLVLHAQGDLPAAQLPSSAPWPSSSRASRLDIRPSGSYVATWSPRSVGEPRTGRRRGAEGEQDLRNGRIGGGCCAGSRWGAG